MFLSLVRTPRSEVLRTSFFSAGSPRFARPLPPVKVVPPCDWPRSVRFGLRLQRHLYPFTYRSMVSSSISRIAVLPMAPINGSPVPWLTSLYHKTYAGPYGDRRYPGNCSGELIKDLLKYFRPKRVLDPMTGSRTCADVCRALGIECVSFDIREGKDATDPTTYLDLGEFDFIWVHPPYWRQKLYSGDPRDLSSARTLTEFLQRRNIHLPMQSSPGAQRSPGDPDGRLQRS